MELVIDIPDNYDLSKIQNGSVASKIVLNAVANGTSLPKGHGRLGDLGEIYVKLNEAQIEGTSEYKGLGEAKQIVCNAPTIVEADRSKDIKQLSSVTPQPKTGHWTRTVDKAEYLVWECNCGWQQRFATNYCPNCGAKMTESEK